MYKWGSKVEELVILSSLCNFLLSAFNDIRNSSNQKLQSCWVAKTLISSLILFFANFDFLEVNFSKTIWYIRLTFLKIAETVMLFNLQSCYFNSLIREWNMYVNEAKIVIKAWAINQIVYEGRQYISNCRWNSQIFVFLLTGNGFQGAKYNEWLLNAV